MAINCTKCESENVQRLSIIYSEGTSKINTSSTSVGMGSSMRGGLSSGMARTTTSGTQQSNLAVKARPPTMQNPFFFFMGALALGIIGGGFVGGFVGAQLFPSDDSSMGTYAFFAVLGTAGFFGLKKAVVAYRWNNNEWPKLKEAWEHSWMCMKCGSVFEQRF